MEPTSYLVAWLLAALLAIGVLSWILARHRRNTAQLLAVHNRLVNFLATQQALWLRDPEHWLESEHDKRFLALWRQHRFTLEALLAGLEEATSLRIHSPAPRRESTYA